MRRLLASLAITFSTYSRIPMPQVEWSEDNMRHTLSLLPLVGLVIGALYCLTDRLSALLGFSPCSGRSADGAAGPGHRGHPSGRLLRHRGRPGLHAPGKKSCILKDSSAGAFAVIWCCVWFLLTFALTAQAVSVPTVAAGFVLSRTFAAWAIQRLPSAGRAWGPP